MLNQRRDVSSVTLASFEHVVNLHSKDDDVYSQFTCVSGKSIKVLFEHKEFMDVLEERISMM